ncbi:MAG: hypothetical protein HKP41_04600 [Desulfobacterales bacterium]|nr:AhpC/TSA family protein [Deltaproteobacteria bacterium]NNK93614.1 hypothetical protein [Desulfobacterales bacterium]
MWQQQEALQKNNLKIIAITFEEKEKNLPISGSNPRDYDYYLDLDKKLYHYFGMFSARFLDIWGPRTWYAYARAILRGQRLQKSRGDINQRGGNVLIDPDGIIRMHHVGSGPGDRPNIKPIIDLIENEN